MSDRFHSRTLAAAFGILVGLGVAGSASAQYYGGWGGWGGWGGSSTVGGDVARGMGVFAAGAGMYNRDTAQANAINTQNRMQLNEYLWQSNMIMRQKYFEKVAAQKQLKTEALKDLEMRHTYNPLQSDIVSGDALNAILHQYSNPSVPHSVVDNVSSDLFLTGDEIKLIPLKFAQDGVVLSIDRLTETDAWPLGLRDPIFSGLIKKYDDMIEAAKNRPEDTDVTDEQIVAAINVLSEIRELARKRLTGRDLAEAETFLKGHVGMLQMLRQPDIKKVIEQAAKKEKVSISNALAFMEVFNLSFGVAKSPQEKALYLQSLYPKLKELRDRVEQEMGNRIPTEMQVATMQDLKAKPPTAAFSNLEWNDISRTAPPVAAPEVQAEDEGEGARR